MVRLCRTSVAQIRFIAALAVLAAVPGTEATPQSAIGPRLVSSHSARRHGLERAWYSRVQLDSARDRVAGWTLSRDRLLVLTSAGVLHALDAHSGATAWVAPLGNPDYPSLGPVADDRFAAMVNGSTLHVIDRDSGRPVFERRVGGAPGAGPVLTRQFVFVPLVSGHIEAYALDDDRRPPWHYQSHGHALVTPLATPESVVWPTSSGHLYVADAGAPAVRYRVATADEIVAPPAFGNGTIFAVSSFGELHAIDEQRGSRRWKYATGYPTDRAPAVVGDRVFVSSDEPSLHCVDAATGGGRWEAADVAQFAAASKSHVYGVDPYGVLTVLDIATGACTSRFPTGGSWNALVNDQTDWLYLISDDGLVQCLHEVGAAEPRDHVPRPAAAAGAPGESPDGAASDDGTYPGEGEPSSDREEGGLPETGPAEGSKGDGENPFGGADDGEAPFRDADDAAGDAPFGTDDEEDPFAF